jgi:hypothetical protein
MKTDERDQFVERLLEGGQPPPPPAVLRQKVLAAARASVHRGPSGDRWSRIWEHRGVRLGWVAAVVMLLIGHLLVMPRHPAAHAISHPELVAERRADPLVTNLLRSVRISDDVQPIVGLFAAADVPADPELKGNHS